MDDLEGDNLELEDYFNVLFNSSEATDLLATSTGANAEGQQAVIDALEGDTEVSSQLLLNNFTKKECDFQAIAIFTELLDDDFALGRRKRRRRRSAGATTRQGKRQG